MTRQQQNTLTIALAVLIILTNLVTFIVIDKVNVPLVGGAFGLLGLPSARTIQDIFRNGEAKP